MNIPFTAETVSFSKTDVLIAPLTETFWNSAEPLAEIFQPLPSGPETKDDEEM
jgi:hypothetical protein